MITAETLVVTEAAREKFDAIETFAREHGIHDRWQARLDYLAGYSDFETVCELWPDWAAYSLSFVMFRIRDGVKAFWFNGGLIYHGPEGDDTLTVDLSDDKSARWGIHT